ncbi:serpin B4 [Uranotaenia lowii]|uniref:serpin B4 n=1 Tax=Uranotaenia lowii TaxID=190385 RepID=UPI00247B168C|nr:serpin B4 [Uranotaenia lowii]XP_055606223.1 serpin B4 [Uranotaenia lowii]XP_055606224.1 serpin B4 [Uranotaenia lowii]
MKSLYAFLLLTIWFICSVSALPRDKATQNDGSGKLQKSSPGRNMVGQSTNVITASMLKGSIESGANQVFSPIGFASILAMISEGAAGQTLQEFYDVFGFPQDRDAVRGAFEESLKRLNKQNPSKEPQFKSWFYIYKNNTVKPDYRTVLLENYYVDVRDIERNDYNFDEPKTSVGPIEQGASDELEVVDSEHPTTIVEQQPEPTDGPSNTNSKDIVDFETLKIKTLGVNLDASVLSDEGIATKYDEVEDEETNPKFDENIDDKEYVEPTKIKEEIAKKKDEHTNEVLEEPVIKIAEERVDRLEVEEMPQKVALSLKKLEEEEHEIMHAVESQVSRRRYNVRRSFLSGDIASALSGNSLVGRKIDAKEGDVDNQKESKMLLFNGLYYRGSWASPFQMKSEEGSFLTNGQRRQVMTMRTTGQFDIGFSQELDARFIQLPYNNSRYSLLVMVPNKPDGLRELIKNFKSNSLSSAQLSLAPQAVEVTMPKFQIDTTSRAEKALAKLGLITMFTSKADLSGITEEQKVHVDELVQHVSIRVDEGSSSETALSAFNAVEAKSGDVELAETTVQPIEPKEQFVVDRPFVFFVRDTLDDVVIVAGKITDIPETMQ